MLELKGNKFKFKMGFKALLMFEEETGISGAELGENIKMQTLVDLCYCAIKSTGENISKELIIDAIDEDLSLLNKINEMIANDLTALNALNSEAGK